MPARVDSLSPDSSKQILLLRNIVVFSEILEDLLYKAALLKLEKLISAISKKLKASTIPLYFRLQWLKTRSEF
jgi:hypothetical protein